MLVTVFQGYSAKNLRKSDFMKSILKEFALGNINPDESFFKENSHYDGVMKCWY